MSSITSISRRPIFAFVIWLSAVATTLAALIVYGSTAGPETTPPRTWPQASQISRQTGRNTLLLFLHPECPCTRATLENLEPLVADRSLPVVLVCLGANGATFDSKPLSQGPCHAQLIQWKNRPNVTLFHDTEGQEAQRFKAVTSGHCLLYAADGNLVYSGGATSSRGHEGANAGLASLREALSDSPEGEAAYPVFGCPLHSDECLPNTSEKPSPQAPIPPTCCERHSHA